MSLCPDPNSLCCPDYAAVYQPCCFDGNDPVVLPSYGEQRARLLIGGTFFRSVFSGELGNLVTVSIVWLDDLPGTDGNITIDPLIMKSVRLTVAGPNEDGSPFIRDYEVEQSAIEVEEGSPLTTVLQWTSDITGLRNAINNDPDCILSMPELDNTSGWGLGSPILTDSDHFSIANGTLSGASGPPTDAGTLATINTSEVITMCYINHAEHTNLVSPQAAKLNNGSIDVFNVSVKEWTGTIWRVYSPTC